MAMIVQLILLIRWVCGVVVHDGVVFVIVLVLGQGSSTIADDVTTCACDNQTTSLLSRRHHRRHRRNSQPRTISTNKGTYACVTDYHPQYKEVSRVHCINIVFSSTFGGVGWGTLSPDDVSASDPAYDNTNTILKINLLQPPDAATLLMI